MRSLTPEEMDTILHKSTCPNCGQPLADVIYYQSEDKVSTTRAKCKPCILLYMIDRSLPGFEILGGHSYPLKDDPRFAPIF